MVGAFWAIKAFDRGVRDLSATATGAGGLLAAISVPWLAERIGLARAAMISMVFIPFQAIMYMSFSELHSCVVPALPTYVFIAWVTSFMVMRPPFHDSGGFRRVKQVLTMPCSLAFGILVYRVAPLYLDLLQLTWVGHFSFH